MWCHYLALSVSIFIISFDYAVPSKRAYNPFNLTPELNEPDWDLLVFTQQWPVTVCREWKDRDPKHKCSMPDDPHAWSIHGIWPTKLHTMGPSFCNRTWHFDYNLIQPIEKELMSSWKNIETETSTYALWAHEWVKHGTCAAVLEPLNSELKYFSKGLEWFKKYDMKYELESHNVYPSNDKGYNVTDLFHMINMHFGVVPMIQCRREHSKDWLSEIRLCFDKNFNLKDCTGVKNIRYRTLELQNGIYIRVITNCNVNEPIFYPKSEDAFLTEESAPSLYVTLYLLTSWLQWFTL